MTRLKTRVGIIRSLNNVLRRARGIVFIHRMAARNYLILDKKKKTASENFLLARNRIGISMSSDEPEPGASRQSIIKIGG